MTASLIDSGIGQGRVTTNLQGAPIDDAVFVTDKEAVEMVRENFIEWKPVSSLSRFY